MEEYEEMEKILQNNIKLNNETIVKKAIDFVVEVLREQGRSFRGDYATESWDYKFHPDIEELYIKWRKKPSENNQQIPKSIKELLMDLKFLDDKPLQIRSYAIYHRFIDAGFDDNMSDCLTRSFMKYFYENDSWRVRMNDVWAEWEYYLSNEDDIEKVKIALRNFVRNYNE